jgi:hypothetical protein
VYSKSEYTIESVSVSVRPSGRIHDNSSQLHPIELKFCTQNCLINISVEFEDENDPPRNGWAIEKIVIIHLTIYDGGYRVFFQKTNFPENYSKHIWIDSVFRADSEYDINFESNHSFLTKSCLKKVSKRTKTVSRDQCAKICRRWLVIWGISKCMVL